MKRSCLLALLPLLFSAPVTAAENAGGLSIVAVVDDEAISSFDVERRMRFVLATTSLSRTEETIERIRPQVVHSLIDEKLQVRAAAAAGIEITEQDVALAIAGIEESRNMPPGAIARMLKDQGVPEETFLAQIRAQILWSKLVARKVRPQVKISEEEITQAVQRFATPSVRREMQVAAITLPVEKPEREQEIRALADKLAGEIRGGASFEEVARQFSASGKTEPFWIRPDQLDPALARALSGLGEGGIAPPLRTPEGYAIMKLYGTRPLAEAKGPEVTLKEILLRLKPDANQREADMLLEIGEEVAKHPGTCQEQGIASIDNLKDFDIEVNFRRDKLAALPPALKIIAENLGVGDISTPFASREGIRLYMLCGKFDAPAAAAPDRDQARNRLMQQKLDLEAQKYMRNLRREAFVEIR